jgi:hypothetical protein
MLSNAVKAFLLISLAVSCFDILAKENLLALNLLSKKYPFNLISPNIQGKKLYASISYLTEEENQHDDMVNFNVDNSFIGRKSYKSLSTFSIVKNTSNSGKIDLRVKGLNFYYASDKFTIWNLKLRKNKLAVRFNHNF